MAAVAAATRADRLGVPEPSSLGNHGPDRPVIDGLRAEAFTVPTDAPESDGTLACDRTTLVGGRIREMV